MTDIDPVLTAMQACNQRQKGSEDWIIMLLFADGSGHFLTHGQARRQEVIVASRHGIPDSGFGTLQGAATNVERLLVEQGTVYHSLDATETVTLPSLFSDVSALIGALSHEDDP
mgnify:CR=1 FL=1